MLSTQAAEEVGDRLKGPIQGNLRVPKRVNEICLGENEMGERRRAEGR